MNTLSSIFGKKEDTPRLSCNLDINQIQSINKYLDTGYGVSLVAINMIDKRFSGIEATIEFTLKYDRDIFVNDILAIWSTYTPIRSKIRSCCVDNTFLDTLDNYKLTNTNDAPSDISEFEIYDYLIDMIIDNDTITFILHKWSEHTPRKLILSLTGS